MVSSPILAQAPTSVLEGTVRDTGGGVVIGATVTVRDVDTSRSRTGVTDAGGAFRFTQLPVGLYRIRVEVPAFEPFEQGGLALFIGQTVRLAVTVVPAGVVESVAVTARQAAIDVRQTSVTTTVDTERIEELPVQSRNYLNFALLAPGVVASQPGAHLKTGSALQDSGFSFAGLRPRSNALTIDGLDNNDHMSGGTRTELSLEAVREFQVVNNAWTAESGGAAGGAVNVVTKSGANIHHGDAFVFGESGRLDAKPKLDTAADSKPSLGRFRAGGAIGGPLVRDRTFVYAALEWERMDGESSTALDPAVAAAVNAALATAAYSGLPVRRLADGRAPASGRETEWSAKVNHQIDARHALMVRAAGNVRDDEGNAFNTGGLFDPSARGSQSISDGGVAASWTAVVSTTMTNELRGQVSTRHVGQHTGESVGPGVSIAGAVDFGRSYVGNASHRQRSIELSDTWGWARGAHFLKAGGDLRSVDITGTANDGTGGFYTFRSVDAFVNGQPDSYRQVFGGMQSDLLAMHAGMFVQDHWTPMTSVTLDAGVRFDVEALPSRLRVTSRQWAPRLGASWLPAPKWVVRGGAGIFPDRMVLASFERALLSDGALGVEHVVRGTRAAQLLAATAGAAPAAPPSGLPPSLYTVQSGAWHSSSRQASAGVERELTQHLTASVNYLFARGHDLTRTVNANLPPPTVLTAENAASLGVAAPVPQQIGRAVYGPARVNAARDGLFELQPTAASAYHGVTVSLNRRLANEIEWAVAYTCSRATDTASDFDEQPQSPTDLASERSASRYDERHRLVISALVDLDIGDANDRPASQRPGFWVRVFGNIAVAPIVTIDSGRPVNPITGADDAQTLAYPATARPMGMTRNSLRTPASASVDVRIVKFFPLAPHGRLDLVVEAFNLLNRTNVTQIDAVYGGSAAAAAAFGRPLDAAPARRIQFSIDFEF